MNSHRRRQLKLTSVVVAVAAIDKRRRQHQEVHNQRSRAIEESEVILISSFSRICIVVRLAMIRFRTEPIDSVLTFEIKPNRIESSEIKSLKFRFGSVPVDLKPTEIDVKTVQKVTLDLIFKM